jgi:hypothetical protein
MAVNVEDRNLVRRLPAIERNKLQRLNQHAFLAASLRSDKAHSKGTRLALHHPPARGLAEQGHDNREPLPGWVRLLSQADQLLPEVSLLAPLTVKALHRADAHVHQRGLDRGNL